MLDKLGKSKTAKNKRRGGSKYKGAVKIKRDILPRFFRVRESYVVLLILLALVVAI